MRFGRKVNWESWRWALLEAGAVHALFRPRQLPAAVAIARRHLASVTPARHDDRLWTAPLLMALAGLGLALLQLF